MNSEHVEVELLLDPVTVTAIDEEVGRLREEGGPGGWATRGKAVQLRVETGILTPDGVDTKSITLHLTEEAVERIDALVRSRPEVLSREEAIRGVTGLGNPRSEGLADTINRLRETPEDELVPVTVEVEGHRLDRWVEWSIPGLTVEAYSPSSLVENAIRRHFDDLDV